MPNSTRKAGFKQQARQQFPQQKTDWRSRGWRVMRSAHSTQDRIFFNARAFQVGDEIAEGIRVKASAFNALKRHADVYAEAQRDGEPTIDNPTGLRRVA